MSPLQPVDGPEPYPQARHAIRLFERTLGRPGWIELLRETFRANKVPIDKAVEAFRASCQGVYSELTELVEAARPEIDTADFRDYLRAVLYGAL